ncbi:hypothetical protein V2J09_006663 [Rumex salicifolius]
MHCLRLLLLPFCITLIQLTLDFSFHPKTMMKKLSSIIVVLALLVIGSSLSGSQVYDIDYRGPETHSCHPPPNRHRKNPFVCHGGVKPKNVRHSQTHGK